MSRLFDRVLRSISCGVWIFFNAIGRGTACRRLLNTMVLPHNPGTISNEKMEEMKYENEC